MTIRLNRWCQSIYTIRNASAAVKKLIIEHTIHNQHNLVTPESYDEKTLGAYRFRLELPATREIKFICREEMPDLSTVTLSNLDMRDFFSYATNGQIPKNVRQALGKAIELKNEAVEIRKEIKKMIKERDRVISDQERLRKNLEAAGNTSPQGKMYLARLAAMDTEIDTLEEKIRKTEQTAEKSDRNYRGYLESLIIES